jgi:glycosyltransferase involved in cell wall biosynthesis
MRAGSNIAVVIPAFNEARAIASVVRAIPAWVDRIVVADNASTDATGALAAEAGAHVVREEEPGYGAACLAGIRSAHDADLVVFVDGDYSDHPEDMADLVDPILEGRAEMVIGSRALGAREPGALTPQQILGHWLATRLIRLIWGARYTDLGPFRAIRRTALDRLGMADRNYGWTVEMQIRAAEAGLKTLEVPVRYRRRIGVSKVSGTLKGTVMAGTKILYVIGRHAVRGRRRTA